MTKESEVLTRSARRPDRTVRTGPRESDVYDVWEAHAPAREVTVALLHGGFWRERYDRHHLASCGAALSDAGYAVANLEYPRVGMPGGGWPGTGEAVRARVQSVLEDPALPADTVVVGHSAGGHLALWLAATTLPPDASEEPPGATGRLLGSLALAPCASLAQVDRLRLSGDAARALLGCAPTQCPDLWADADPATRPALLPVELVTAADDEVVPASVVTAYLATRRADEQVRLTNAPAADHFDVIDPLHPAFLIVRAALSRLTDS